MTLEKFIAQYKVASDKEKFLEERIKVKYIPYNEKIVLCKAVVKNTMHTTINNKEIFLLDSPGEFLFFHLMLIKKYTDIDIDMKDNPLVVYDSLDELGLIDALIGSIPDSEYIKFKTILDMVKDDTYENERSLVSFLETKIDALTVSIDSISGAFAQLQGGMTDGSTGDNSAGAIL